MTTPRFCALTPLVIARLFFGADGRFSLSFRTRINSRAVSSRDLASAALRRFVCVRGVDNLSVLYALPFDSDFVISHLA